METASTSGISGFQAIEAPSTALLQFAWPWPNLGGALLEVLDEFLSILFRLQDLGLNRYCLALQRRGSM